MSVFNKNLLYFVDTNIFLRSLVKENEKLYQESLKFLKLISSRKIRAYISTPVIMEINFVLSSFYKFGKEKITGALESIINFPSLKIIDDFDHNTALDLYINHNVKFIDCLFASSRLIQQNQACIVSFDEDFKKLPLKSCQPKELVCYYKI